MFGKLVGSGPPATTVLLPDRTVHGNGWKRTYNLSSLCFNFSYWCWITNYVPERPFMHLAVCCWFLISSGWAGGGEKLGSWRGRSEGAELEGEKKGVEAVFRIHMFLGLLDPDPSVRCMDLDPGLDPSITKQKKWEKTLIPAALWLLFDNFIFENDVHVPSKSNKQRFFV